MDDQRASRIEGKLDQIANDIGDIKVTQAEQHASLEYHIKRTDILEEVTRPLIEFASAVKVAMKIIGLLALGAGIAEGIVALLEYLK